LLVVPDDAQSSSTPIAFREGMDRAVSPSSTLDRLAPFLPAMGITRVANLTGLDRPGIPVVSVCRPNSRSLSVAQGKGLTLEAARVSGLMESLESHHAEHIQAPLCMGSYRDLRGQHRMVDPAGLPRLKVSSFNENRPLLWIEGIDLIHGEPTLVPYELVHTDFRLPLPTGSGAFFMSSNGLASGNCLAEAMGHALCELVERDANTLFTVSPEEEQAARKVDLGTVDDLACRAVLDRFEEAGISVIAWETTTEIGIPSFLCTIVDRDPNAGRPMPPLSGSGCHPRRRIALLRALTEAAQARLTIISGARDDLSSRFFDERGTLITKESARFLAETRGGRRAFHDAANIEHDSFEADLRWALQALVAASFSQAVAVNLTKTEIGIPVVRLVVPYLEAMIEVRGYVLGRRAQRKLYGAAS
jgi:YcaO-like protein with predicted kinase domain